MDQSGPWTKASELIIDRPEGQPPLHRAAFGVVTFAFWAMWIYLMMPALTLLGWAFGASRFVDVMIVQGGAMDVVRLLVWYLLVILIMCGSLIGWALYNWRRFRNATRRSNTLKPLANANVAARLGVEERVLADWQQRKVMDVEFDEHGRIAAVDEPTQTQLSTRPHQPIAPCH